MTLTQKAPAHPTAAAVLGQFRVIYGSVRQHFQYIEEHCGVSGSQLWLLDEIARAPGAGAPELATRMSIHQTLCRDLLARLEAQGLIFCSHTQGEQGEDGFHLTEHAAQVLAAAPGPTEGVLPQALQGLPDDTLEGLHLGLAEVIAQLTVRAPASAKTPLADL